MRAAIPEGNCSSKDAILSPKCVVVHPESAHSARIPWGKRREETREINIGGNFKNHIQEDHSGGSISGLQFGKKISGRK